MDKLVDVDQHLNAVVEHANQAKIHLNEVQYTLSDQFNMLEQEEGDISSINGRLSLLNKLFRKYKMTGNSHCIDRLIIIVFRRIVNESAESR